MEDNMTLDNQKVNSEQLQEAVKNVEAQNNGRQEGEGVKKIIETNPGEFHTLSRIQG